MYSFHLLRESPSGLYKSGKIFPSLEAALQAAKDMTIQYPANIIFVFDENGKLASMSFVANIHPK